MSVPCTLIDGSQVRIMYTDLGLLTCDMSLYEIDLLKEKHLAEKSHQKFNDQLNKKDYLSDYIDNIIKELGFPDKFTELFKLKEDQYYHKFAVDNEFYKFTYGNDLDDIKSKDDIKKWTKQELQDVDFDSLLCCYYYLLICNRNFGCAAWSVVLNILNSFCNDKNLLINKMIRDRNINVDVDVDVDVAFELFKEFTYYTIEQKVRTLFNKDVCFSLYCASCKTNKILPLQEFTIIKEDIIDYLIDLCYDIMNKITRDKMSSTEYRYFDLNDYFMYDVILNMLPEDDLRKSKIISDMLETYMLFIKKYIDNASYREARNFLYLAKKLMTNQIQLDKINIMISTNNLLLKKQERKENMPQIIGDTLGVIGILSVVTLCVALVLTIIAYLFKLNMLHGVLNFSMWNFGISLITLSVSKIAYPKNTFFCSKF